MLLCIILVLIPLNLYSGGICSSAKVKPSAGAYDYSVSPEVVLPDTEAKIKQQRITATVGHISLAVIYMLHSRVGDDKFAAFRLDPDELWMFREAVRVRYEENKEAIEVIVKASVERHREMVHRETVRNLKRERRRRLAWRSDDSFKSASPKLASIPSDDSKEEKKDSE